MLPANLISALQVLSNSGRPLVTTAQDAQRQPPDAQKSPAKLEVGQQLEGTVQAKVNEGLFKVQVAGQTIQMRLPGNVRSGDTVRLEVVSLQPRITFGLASSSNPVSTPEQIGSAARLLSNLSERPIERPLVRQLDNKAVWASEEKAPDTKLLAGALREALGKSGLFYESHQAQWIRGERSIHQLLEEPQNRLTGKNLPADQYAAPGKDQAALAGRLAGEQRAAADSAAASQTSTQARHTGETAQQPIAKELVHLVQQQLHTLEQHHLVWLGQVWPGQQMQWEIQGQPEHRGQPQGERKWSTEMELTLPRLGNVHAHLMLAENAVRVTLRATDPATIELFGAALPGLKSAFSNAGIPLAAVMVEKS